MSTTSFRYDRKIAKRNHKRACAMSGLPIEKGDRYFECSGVYDGDFYGIKAHSILQEMADEYMAEHKEDSWDPWLAGEYLQAWLRKNLHPPTWHQPTPDHWGEWVDHPEVATCYTAALAHWDAR